MIEVILLNYLKKALDVPVSMEKNEADEYVLIEKTGSSKENHVNSATFAIQSHAKSLYKASELNEKVKSAMDAIVYSECDISKAQLNSDYNFTDTTTKQYRYQAVYDLVFLS